MNAYNLLHKIQQLREHDERAIQKDVTEIDLADLMFKLNAKYPSDIEEHHGARNIIDL
jgi:hypothetical protein